MLTGEWVAPKPKIDAFRLSEQAFVHQMLNSNQTGSLFYRVEENVYWHRIKEVGRKTNVNGFGKQWRKIEIEQADQGGERDEA